MTEMIITEKPKTATKIANALADGKPIREKKNGVPYYKVTHGNKDLLVACAVGHLYSLAEKKDKKKGMRFPVFDITWVPSSEVSKTSKFSKKYLTALKSLAKQCDDFTVACDYDIEGEVIGLNIVRYACKQEDARRMKFSTLTKPDLVKAYENISPHLDWGQAYAGETRHKLDWFYGINISRALMTAIKNAGMFKILSTGRVQGPALKIVVDREKEIKAFKPVPFWQIQLLGDTKEKDIEAWHVQDKFWEKKKADNAMENVRGADKGKVAEIEKKQFRQKTPTPFDLTSMQIEAYRLFKIKPKDALSIAQNLYTDGYISYPRTSSQKLPKEIGYQKILKDLSRQEKYKELCYNLLGTKLEPNEGKKSDPAHPAIYPTGTSPKKMDARSAKVYDLIVRRFMATFGKPAMRETVHISIDVNSELFGAKGTRTVDKGWHVYYGPYVKIEEQQMPAVVRGDEVNVKEINFLDKETQPPKRYTEASIIKELEKRNLGTKATRAQIVDTLQQRSYITGVPIEATELGIKVESNLETYVPKIVDEELTMNFEMQMEEIREGKKTEEEVLSKAKEVLTKILDEFKQHQEKIGEGLARTFKETRAVMETVGKCPNCKEGMLMIRKGKFGRFVACDKYPECKTTFKLPATGMVKPTDKTCEHCGHPMILMIRKRKKPQEVCINPDCPSKLPPKDKLEEMEGSPCPKCKEGKLVLRKSVYGAFFGCNRFPKCHYTQKMEQDDKPAEEISEKAKESTQK
ncbi:DNA topoisomerase I [Candidatus Woesearchaeota archaeon]|nr:DNA topoisomerase I [Candidatus Woesearchaeota archaeon]